MAQARDHGEDREAMVPLPVDRLLVSVEELGREDDVEEHGRL